MFCIALIVGMTMGLMDAIYTFAGVPLVKAV